MPSLGLQRELHPFRSDKHRADFRPGKVADDVECLEVMPETVVLADRYCEQETAVIPAVEGCGYRVDAHLLAQVEHLSRERQFVHVYLRSQSAVPYKPFYGIGKALVYEITVRRHYSLIFEQGMARLFQEDLLAF